MSTATAIFLIVHVKLLYFYLFHFITSLFFLAVFSFGVFELTKFNYLFVLIFFEIEYMFFIFKELFHLSMLDDFAKN